MATTDPSRPNDVSAMTASEGMSLTTEQQFDLVRMGRIIDGTSDVVQLRQIAKELLEAWQTQRAATNWAISQQTGWKANGLQNYPLNR